MDNDILDWDTQFDISQHYVNPFFVQGLYFDLASGAGDPFERIDFDYIGYTNVNSFAEQINAGSYNYTKTTSDTDGSVTFYLTTKTDGNVYVFYNVDGASNENVTFNFSETTISRPCSQDQIVDLGRHKKGESITINIPFEQNSGGLRLYAYTMNDGIFRKGFDKLSKNTLNITSFKNTEIKGTVSNKESSVLYTSIPYDEGWSVYVDRKKVTGENYLEIGGALLGIRLEKGNHQVEFRYTVKNLSAGAFISAVSLAVLLLIILLSLHRKKKKNYAFDPVNVHYTESDVIAYKAPTVKEEAKQPSETEVKKEFGCEIIYPPKAEFKKEIITPPSRNENTNPPYSGYYPETENNKNGDEYGNN